MKQIVLLCCIFIALKSFAQPVTWSNSVACIIYTHCTTCHNDNGIAQFSLMTYQQNYHKRFDIFDALHSNIMPPRMPNPDYRNFAHERYLTTKEKSLIINWVLNDAPIGDSVQAPTAPVYPTTSQMSNVSSSFRMPDYAVPSFNWDEYRCFVLTNPYPTAVYLTAFEVLPGNGNALHHLLLFQDTSSIPVSLQNADTVPGYINAGGTGSNSGKLIGGWFATEPIFSLPQNMAIKIDSGARLIMQAHYPVCAFDFFDSTRINLRFDTSANLREVKVEPLLNQVNSLTNGPFVIPADSIVSFHEQFTLTTAVTLLSISPHAHYLCTNMYAYAVTPTNDTIPLIGIDEWELEKQTTFNYHQPLFLPSGTVLHGEATFDNTSANYMNPNLIPQTIYEGEQTTDEKMQFYFSYLPYQTGDENIVVDTSTFIPTYNNCTLVDVPSAIKEETIAGQINIFPNPSTGEFSLQTTVECDVLLRDLSGRVLKAFHCKEGIDHLTASEFPAGIYLVELSNRIQNLYNNMKWIKID